MRKGENIFKRKDGRWEARYIKGHEISGKVRYGFCYGRTYREAKDKVGKCKAAVLNGTMKDHAPVRNRFGYFCEEWLRNGKNRWKESTYIKYETMLQCHIRPKLGGCYPSGITSETITAFSEELRQEGLSPKTIRDILVVLRSILKYTARYFPGDFPSVDIVYPQNPRKEMRVLTLEEQKRLVSCLLKDMDPCRFGILLAVFTGMRIGELCALRWENINLKDKTIRINATMQRLKNQDPDNPAKTKITITLPKSEMSVRTIPMTDEIAGLCRKMWCQDGKAFILTGNPQYMEPRTLQNRLKKITRECGLENVHFHTLRHTFATRCVEVGFEIKSLSEILGHANTAITLERYVHSSLEMKRSNMNKLKAIGL